MQSLAAASSSPSSAAGDIAVPPHIMMQPLQQSVSTLAVVKILKAYNVHVHVHVCIHVHDQEHVYIYMYHIVIAYIHVHVHSTPYCSIKK